MDAPTTKNEPSQRRRRFFWRVVLGLILVGVLACWTIVLFFPSRFAGPDPIVGGKPVSEWVRLYVESAQREYVDKGWRDWISPEPMVIRAGTNAVPHVLAAIKNPPCSHRSLAWNLVPYSLLHRLPKAIRQQAHADHLRMIQQRAYVLLARLGTNAAPALPFLLRRAEQGFPESHPACRTLAMLSPDLQTQPALLRLMKHHDRNVRAGASEALVKLRPVPPEAIQTLIAQLADRDVISRRMACVMLLQAGQPYALPAIPALVKAYGDTGTVFIASHALAKLSPETLAELERGRPTTNALTDTGQ